jgi:aldehyde dehydrogenase
VSILDTGHFIGGARTVCATDDRITVSNPARPQETVGTIAAGSGLDVDRAVAAAVAAQREWASRTVTERCALVKAAGEALAAAAPEAAPTLTREMGKVLAESMMDFGAPGFGWNAFADDVAGVEDALSTRVSDDFGTIELRRRPVGVVGAIVPWNWPLALLGVKLGPALIAGNAVVAVPSPYASLSVLQAVEAMAAVLPAGVVNVVTGYGHEVGAALVAHRDVSMVAFTGGAEAGRAVASGAGTGLKRSILELGGNDAAVLLDDVQVTDSLIASLAGAFSLTSGQVCFAIKRLYVHDTIYDEVVTRLSDALAATVVGDGLDPEVTMGPLANQTQHERFSRLMNEAELAGAKVRELGSSHRSVTGSGGYFHLPKLVTDIDPRARLVVDEQFGPALPVLAFNDDAAALEQVNGTDFGLTASVWSTDPARARAMAERIDAGVCFVNQHGLMAFDLSAPFGGTKQSGYGREMGLEGMLEFTWTQQINDRHVVMG